MGHIAGIGELNIHRKFLSENEKIGYVLGDADIDFVDENERTFQKWFVIV